MRTPQQAHGSNPVRPSKEERRRRKRSGLLILALALIAIAGVILFTPTGPDERALLSLGRWQGNGASLARRADRERTSPYASTVTSTAEANNKALAAVPLKAPHLTGD
jgi:hypothetical protein